MWLWQHHVYQWIYLLVNSWLSVMVWAGPWLEVCHGVHTSVSPSLFLSQLNMEWKHRLQELLQGAGIGHFILAKGSDGDILHPRSLESAPRRAPNFLRPAATGSACLGAALGPCPLLRPMCLLSAPPRLTTRSGWPAPVSPVHSPVHPVWECLASPFCTSESWTQCFLWELSFQVLFYVVHISCFILCRLKNVLLLQRLKSQWNVWAKMHPGYELYYMYLQRH